MPSRNLLMVFLIFAVFFALTPAPLPLAYPPAPSRSAGDNRQQGASLNYAQDTPGSPQSARETAPAYYSTRSREQAADKPTGRSRAQDILIKS